MEIARLFARIGIKTDSEPVRKFQNDLMGVVKVLGIGTLSATAFVAGLKKISDEAFRSALALKQFHSETGVSTDELQKWQSVADQSNVSAEAVTNSIKAIVDNQQKIKLGQGGLSGYYMLGIDPKQDPFKILEDLRVKTQGLSQGMKKNMLGQLGVSSELIQVLDLTNDEFNRMKSNAFIISPSAIDLMAKANSSSRMVGQAITYLGNVIATQLAPSIMKVNGEIIKFIRENQEGLVKIVKTLFEWITKIVGAVINATKMIDIIIRGTIGWRMAIIALIAIIGVLNASLLLSPIGIFIAGIMLLVLVLDDLYVYSKGGRSLFGELIKQYPAFKTFSDILINIFGLIKGLFTGEDVDKYMEKLGLIGKAIKGYYDAWKMTIDNLIIEPIKQILNFLQFIEKLFSDKDRKNAWNDFMQKYSQGGADIGKRIPIFGQFSDWIDKTTRTGKYSTDNSKITENTLNLTINANVKDTNELAKKTTDAWKKEQQKLDTRTKPVITKSKQSTENK